MKMFVQIGMVFFVLLTLWAAPYAIADTYTYDDTGRLTQVEYDSGYVTTYTYDDAGNILEQRTRKKRLQSSSSAAETDSAAETGSGSEVKGEALETPPSP